MKHRTSILAAAFGLVLAALAPLGACMPTNDTVGGGAGGNSGAGGAAPSCVPVDAGSQHADFASVQETVSFYCGGSGCHNAGQAPDLFAGDLYTTLTTFKSTMCGNRFLVKPCHPEDSAFYLAQAGQCPGLDKMPKGCVDQCTDPDFLEGIRQWIANGAPKQ